MEHQEIANVLGISRRTVSRRLERFVESARDFLIRSEIDGKQMALPAVP
jgi:RNA polymerase sigma-70 factor (ECF subfamily)